MKSRIFILLVILSFAFAAVSYAENENEDGSTVYFYENFERYSEAVPIGWSISASSVSPYKSKDTHGGCAKVISTADLYDAALCRYFAKPPETGNVYVHFSIKLPDVIYQRNMCAFRDRSNKECITVMFTQDGYIKTHSGITLQSYQVGKWYDFIVKLDMNSKSYDVWIDGKKLAGDVKFSNSQMTDIYYLKFSQLQRNNSYCILDNLYAYRADGILSEKTVAEKYLVKFDDIADSPVREEIEELAAIYVLSNTADGKLHPEDNVTKAEFTVWIRGIMGLSEDSYSGMCTDVSADDSVAGSVQALVVSGACGPYGGTWDVNAPVTVNEASVMMIEGYKYKKNTVPGETKFAAMQDKGAWSRNYEAQADYLRLFSGVNKIEKASGNSGKVLTKAQAIKLLCNYRNVLK